VEGKTNALSIAHTGECGIAIAGSGRIALGIDIEPVTRFRSLKTDILCGEEHRLIAAFGGEDDNTQGIFWTAKEALAKCVGTGLSTPLCVFEVGHVERWGPMTSLRFRNFPAFQGYVWQNGSFFVALCLRCAEVTSVSQMA
jgi:phosphopantetheinyl transferase